MKKIKLPASVKLLIKPFMPVNRSKNIKMPVRSKEWMTDPYIPSYVKDTPGVRVMKPDKGQGYFIWMHDQWWTPSVLPPKEKGGQPIILG